MGGSTTQRIGLGVIGLGRAFAMMRPSFLGPDAHPGFTIVAAADPRPEARARIAAEFGARAYATAEEMCADPGVAAVYVATPHEAHAENVRTAARAGRHVLVEKPMALSLADCTAMVGVAEMTGVVLLVGHSHSFDAPVAAARRLIASGAHGAVRMIHAFNATDFLYRPRRPEELDTARGGGAVFNQAPHQVDIVRLLAGGMATRVRAHTGAWDGARPTEGAYAALVDFEDGCFASLTYSGYAHFDTDALSDWIGETGHRRDPAAHGAARRALAASSAPEAALRQARGYGRAGAEAPSPGAHEHFGFVLACCERADLRLLPDRIEIFGDAVRSTMQLPPPRPPRREVWDAFHTAITTGTMPTQTGAWGLATMELCLAILQSAREGREITLAHQVPA
jgi:phthalate 4,5-cis-dihydrodiol dehydrogenase